MLFESFHHFIGLFKKIACEALVCLQAIPWATIGVTSQTHDNITQCLWEPMCAQLIYWRNIKSAEMISEGVAIKFVEGQLNNLLILIDACCSYQFDWPFIGIAFTQSQFHLTGNASVVK